MTVEKMEKARELNQRIKYLKEQLERVERVIKDHSIRVVANNSSFDLPSNIKDTILVLAKADYISKLEKTEKEFEEL